jgi:RNA polymerase sigma-70 factor (ECF subfamily)
MTDAEVIAASHEQRELFALIYDRHAPALYRYAARRLGADAAEDVVSETMLAAFRRRRRYDTSRSDARPWLFGILTREISQRRRVERSRYRTLGRLDRSADLEHEAADEIASAVAAQAVRAPLMAALARLATRDREVLLLAAWADLSYQEIADALHIPIGTVGSRLRAGVVEPETVPGGAADVALDGKQVLLAAASRARSEPTLVPDPDAFIYTRERHKGWSTSVHRRPHVEESDVETWWSVDGTGGVMVAGWIGPDVADMMVAPCADQRTTCWDPGYVTDLPTDPAEMLAYLTPDPAMEWNEPATVFDSAWDLLQERMVPPEARAAIFEALATLPEHEVITGVETATGEIGTAVGYNWRSEPEAAPAYRSELVFDPETHALIGSRWVDVKGDQELGIPPGSATLNVAIIEQAVVPELRVRPDGSRNTAELRSSEPLIEP